MLEVFKLLLTCFFFIFCFYYFILYLIFSLNISSGNRFYPLKTGSHYLYNDKSKVAFAKDEYNDGGYSQGIHSTKNVSPRYFICKF